MKIYDFDSKKPPVLHERELYEKAKERRLRRQTRILVAGSLLSALAAVFMAVVSIPYSLIISTFCFFISLYILIGGGVVAVMFLCRGARMIAER